MEHNTAGRLVDAAGAPPNGEQVFPLFDTAGVRIERILSGTLDGPVGYVQDHDEWVLLLEGAAVIEVEGRVVDLVAGDWLVLPSGVPHRLVRTEPGSNWLAVRVPADPPV